MADNADNMEQGDQFTRAELLLFCRAVANIIVADRTISEDERQHLDSLTRELGLSPADPEVRKAVDSELATPSKLEELLAPLTNPALRRTLYRTLVEVALSDGLAPQEDQKLTQLALSFDLNGDAARDLIKWTMESLALEKRESDIMQRL